MRSNLEALSFRVAVFASGLALFVGACSSSSGPPNKGTGGSTGDGSTDTKIDSGAGGTGAGGKTDSGTTDSGAGGKTDSGTTDSGTGGKLDAGMDSGMDSGMGGAMLVPPWHAFLPLGMAAPGSGTASGTVLDLSPNHYDGTYIGTTITFANGSMNLMGLGSETVVVPPKNGVPAVDTSGSYSVSAWVTLTNTGGFRTVVSGEGINIASFFLQKRGDTNAWAFTTETADSTSAPGCIVPGPVAPDGGPAPSPVTPLANVQYHLAATVDATTGMHILYVNGVESGRLTCGAGFADTGVLGIGHGIFNTGRVDNVQGSIAEVGVINRALTPTEVADLYMRGRIGMPPPPPIDSGVDTTPPVDSGTDAPVDTGTPDGGTDGADAGD